MLRIFDPHLDRNARNTNSAMNRLNFDVLDFIKLITFMYRILHYISMIDPNE